MRIAKLEAKKYSEAFIFFFFFFFFFHDNNSRRELTVGKRLNFYIAVGMLFHLNLNKGCTSYKKRCLRLVSVLLKTALTERIRLDNVVVKEREYVQMVSWLNKEKESIWPKFIVIKKNREEPLHLTHYSSIHF
jgi:hypothetical protein